MVGVMFSRACKTTDSFFTSVFRFQVNKFNSKQRRRNGTESIGLYLASKYSTSQPEIAESSVHEVTSASVPSKQNDDTIEAIKKPLNQSESGVLDFLRKPNIRSKLKGFTSLTEYRHIYSEFLPEPDPSRRHKTREILERSDMLNRRRVIDIPEFYVGSILAVTAADQYAPGKKNRFVGICILRAERGLRYCFTLRNVVDHQGVEIMYELYNPCILKIEVLRLEKRLDEQLLYLRDADPKYSTFPFEMEAEHHPENKPVPVNDIKIPIRDFPWFSRWDLWNLKGVLPFKVPEHLAKNEKKNEKPWLTWDLMIDYRKRIPEEDQLPIWVEVEKHHQEMKRLRKTDRKKILLQQALEKK